MEKGNLLLKLVDYEDKGLNKNSNLLAIIILFIADIAVFGFVYFQLYSTMYNPYNDDENILFYIIIFSFLVFEAVSSVWAINSRKRINDSYLYIYDNQIEGMAQTNSSLFNSSLESFCLSYNDILSLSSDNKFVIIYTQWQTYKILAFGKQSEIIQIINKRKNNEAVSGDKPYNTVGKENNNWKCNNCGESNSSNTRFCMKCGSAKTHRPMQQTAVKTSVAEQSHKCTCGERVYGDCCPNCGRSFK